MANNVFENCATEAQGNTTDAAGKAAFPVAQAILESMSIGGHSLRSTNAAKPESFNRSRDKAKQFIQSVWISIMMQLNTFKDGWKSYMLSPSCKEG